MENKSQLPGSPEGHKQNLGVRKMFYITNVMAVTKLCTVFKTYRVVHLKLVSFISRKLYVNKATRI